MRVKKKQLEAVHFSWAKFEKNETSERFFFLIDRSRFYVVCEKRRGER